MSDPTVTCPHCHTEIRLTESLAAPLIAATRKDFEARLAGKEREIAQREETLRKRQTQVEAAGRALEQQLTERLATELAAERPRIAAEEARRAQAASLADLEARQREITDLRQTLESRSAKLAAAQKAEADFLRRQRELEDARRELEVTVEKRVNSSAEEIRNRARQEAEDALTLKISEKDLLIQSMNRQIDELRRKAEQGSQQLQGEAQEVELENLLTARFVHDTITPVPKGEFGGDVIQTVMSPLGSRCGTILWESKRTKNWSDGWLAKLRGDQRAAKADVAVIVSTALPKEVEHFNLIDGVYVVGPRCVVPVAITLRQALMEISVARQATAGQQTKMELIYHYLTGSQFRQRIQAIVETFTAMQKDLADERRVIQKQWAKREIQIDRVIESTAGLYGDLQGIAGRTLQEIEGLSLSALEYEESGRVEAGTAPGDAQKMLI